MTEYKHYIFNPEWLKSETEKKKENLAKTKPNVDFVEFACSVIMSIINKDKLRYRIYGPYWWAVKKILIEQGYSIQNTDMDIELANIYCGENDAETLVAAEAFSHDILTELPLYNQKFALTDNGEYYNLYDDDMEGF